MNHPTPSLEEVAAHFEHWRQTRTNPKDTIPNTLKEETATLIGRYSSREILKTLRLSYTQLKSLKKKVLLSRFLVFLQAP